VLSKAGARDGGTAVVPAKMNKAAASKVGASLMTRKLCRTKPLVQRSFAEYLRLSSIGALAGL
jgi:hypothetical protein